MIRSFADGDTEKLFNSGRVRRFPSEILDRARKKMLVLHRAANLEDMRRPPANRLEALRRDREGQYSVRINDQRRLCFRWADGNAYDVEVTDYHRG